MRSLTGTVRTNTSVLVFVQFFLIYFLNEKMVKIFVSES